MLGNVVMRPKPQMAYAAAGAHTSNSRSVKSRHPKPPSAPKKNFPAGVMAGDVTHNSAVLWTRYTGNKTLKVRIVSTPHINNVAVSVVIIKEHGFVHYDAKGLSAGMHYKYEFYEYAGSRAVSRSPWGQFRTAIAPGALDPVTFGGTSCTNQSGKHLRKTNNTLLGAARQRNLAFFLHAGDQVYCDDRVAGGPPKTRTEYRARYQKAFSRRGLKKLHQTFGMYTTWDDHEVFNAWQGEVETLNLYKQERELREKIRGTNPGPGRIKLKQELRYLKKIPRRLREDKNLNLKQVMNNGVRSFFDHQPICASPPQVQPAERKEKASRSRKQKKLWGSFQWGHTLELFILDCRSERNRSTGEYITTAQMNWLTEGLRKSRAVFKFILNSCPIGRFPKINERGDRWLQRPFLVQRAEILAVAQDVGGVWWLSGDLHFGSVGGVGKGRDQNADGTPAYPTVGEVLMGPGGQDFAKRNRQDGIDKRIKKRSRRAAVKNLSKKKKYKVFGKTYGTLKNNYVVIHADPRPNKRVALLKIKFYRYKEKDPFWSARIKIRKTQKMVDDSTRRP